MRLTTLFLIAAWIMTLAPDVSAGEQGSLTLMDAVSDAIANSYDVILARETVRYKEAQVRIEKGEQDVEISTDISFENDNASLTPYYQSLYRKEAQDTETLTSTLEAEKELQSGITLTSGLTLNRENDSLLTSPPDNTSEVYFKVTLPVLKLWTRGLKIGKIKNSEIDLDASRKDLAATVSTSVQSVANAFWDALARKKILENSRAVEADAKTFLSEMTILVEKNEYPAANLDSVQADLDTKAVSRISAEQTYFEALQTLALTMGTDADLLARITDVEGEFPVPQAVDKDTATLIRLARESRPDLEADKIRVAYYRELLSDAEEDMLPDLDLSLKGGYQGLEETSSGKGYLHALNKNVPGPTYTIGLSYSIALGNNVAGGKYQQTRITLAKEEIGLKNLYRTVTSDVLTAVQALGQSLAALKQQQAAVAAYKSALKKESIKFRLQMSSLSDQIDARDNYYNSLNVLVSKQQAYAQSLAGLHHACGTLVEHEGDTFRIRQASLFSPAITTD